MADYGLLFQPAKTIKGGDVNNKCWTMCKSIPRLKTLEIIGTAWESGGMREVFAHKEPEFH